MPTGSLWGPEDQCSLFAAEGGPSEDSLTSPSHVALRPAHASSCSCGRRMFWPSANPLLGPWIPCVAYLRTLIPKVVLWPPYSVTFLLPRAQQCHRLLCTAVSASFLFPCLPLSPPPMAPLRSLRSSRTTLVRTTKSVSRSSAETQNQENKRITPCARSCTLTHAHAHAPPELVVCLSVHPHANPSREETGYLPPIASSLAA